MPAGSRPTAARARSDRGRRSRPSPAGARASVWRAVHSSRIDAVVDGRRRGAREARGTSARPSDVVDDDDERPVVASVSRNRRPPQNSSRDRERADDRPMADATRSAMPAVLAGRHERSPPASRRAPACRPRSMPAASRTISASGQNVMPSPYGRQRPRRTVRRRRRAAVKSAIRRVLPTPASPIDGDAGGRCAARRPGRARRCRVASSASRPTSGAACDRSSRSAASGLATREQPVGRHPLRLALQLERLDLLDLDVVADEVVGRLADQDLVRRARPARAERRR